MTMVLKLNMLWVSLLFFLMAIVFLCTWQLITRKKGYTGIQRATVCTLFLAASVFFVVLYLNINQGPIEKCGIKIKNGVLSQSFLQMLQTFSLDAPYEELITNLHIILAKAGIPNLWVSVIKIYASLIFSCAPIAGGFILFEIIAKFFPRVRGILSLVRVYKDIVYFSELNERSLTFAKSIISKYKWFNCPILIFTDVYSDDEKEKDTELLLSAKTMGAICINDDILHICLRKQYFKFFGKTQIFLIDDSEENNIHTLAVLSDEKHFKSLKNAEIYLFAENDYSSFVEQTIENNLKNKNEVAYSKIINKRKEIIKNKILNKVKTDLQKIDSNINELNCIDKNSNEMAEVKRRINSQSTIKNDTVEEIKKYIEKRRGKLEYEKSRIEKPSFVDDKVKEELNYYINTELMPDIHLISAKKNIVRNLLIEKPLFEPLIGNRNQQKRLCVTIVGAGDLGTEAFLTTYWMGQILNCQLLINVISKEEEDNFKNKINFINTDILKTSEESKDDSLLKIYDDENNKELSPAYFNYEYVCADAENTNDDVKKMYINSDYIIVTLGSDEKNIIVAEKIKRIVKIENLKAEKEEDKKRRIIAYAVYDSDVCRSLNQKCLKDNTYMYAFGSLESIYSTQNIYMENSRTQSESIHNAYEKRTKEVIDENRKKLKQTKKSAYDYWADIARAMHIQYKVFSADMIEQSIFDVNVKWPIDKFRSFEDYLLANRNDCLKKYMNKLKIASKADNKKNETELMVERIIKEFNNKKKVKDLKWYNKIAWLEHRRWNAFLRANGFVGYDNFNAYYNMDDYYVEGKPSHKNLELKLHPCIVECSENGIIGDIFDSEGAESTEEKIKLDKLDLFSIKFKEESGKTDYKVYDYPEYDFKCNEYGEIEYGEINDFKEEK